MQNHGDTMKRTLSQKTYDYFFRKVHGGRLIYNACWEDPRIDRRLLQFDERSKVVMITSAGCNALDYLLDDPAEIHAIDVNPRQNAVLQLKLALLMRGDFEDLESAFGHGYHRAFGKLLESLWSYLPQFATDFWRSKKRYFASHGFRDSYYYHGTAGEAALLLRTWLGAKRGVRHAMYELFEAKNLDEQRDIFRRIEPSLRDRATSWIIGQPVLMTMMGVPRPQVQLIAKSTFGGLATYVREKVKHVLTEVLSSENYFWRVYLHGHYTKSCCPNYLKEENHKVLKERAERVRTYDTTLAGFLKHNPGEYTHFILLDHQDWMAYHARVALKEEWELILQNSIPGTKVLMRSAGSNAAFLPSLATKALHFFPQLTDSLHPQDRVGTYGSTHLAEVL
jgi:S-adenosylmethionine-diacylglycerol 3-amino-3-carboxypropyl transferase